MIILKLAKNKKELKQSKKKFKVKKGGSKVSFRDIGIDDKDYMMKKTFR